MFDFTKIIVLGINKVVVLPKVLKFCGTIDGFGSTKDFYSLKKYLTGLLTFFRFDEEFSVFIEVSVDLFILREAL